DRSIERLRQIDELYGDRISTLYSTRDSIDDRLPRSDLVIGAVLVPGAAAPRLVTRSQLKLMQSGSVLVDVAIDQGGCFETSHPTTHDAPTYEVDGIIHYCVANMPGAVARTSTFALTNATLPRVLELADKGVAQAMADDVHLRNGLNVHAGRITHRAVADVLSLPHTQAAEALASLRHANAHDPQHCHYPTAAPLNRRPGPPRRRRPPRRGVRSRHRPGERPRATGIRSRGARGGGCGAGGVPGLGCDPAAAAGTGDVPAAGPDRARRRCAG